MNHLLLACTQVVSPQRVQITNVRSSAKQELAPAACGKQKMNALNSNSMAHEDCGWPASRPWLKLSQVLSTVEYPTTVSITSVTGINR